MLNHVYQTSERSNLRESIKFKDNKIISKEEAKDDAKAFIEVF